MTAMPDQDGPGVRPTLDALGRLHGTDKSSGNHAYLPTYDQFFEPMRDRNIKLLEIGIKEGASLRVWSDYFPHAQIIGADIRPTMRRFAGNRVEVEIGDQGDPEFLLGIAQRHGPFDIVVEDGSHQWPHQILAIKHLVPALKPGGIFISEDLQVSFPPLSERYARGAPRSAYKFLQELAERVLRYRDLDQAPSDDPELGRLVPLLSWVLFLRHASILRRRD